MHTVLDAVSESQITWDPYPHLVVENAAEPELCRELIDSFPPLDLFTHGRTHGDNIKIYCPSRIALQDERVPHVWKDFLRAHLTPNFFAHLMRIFGPALQREYPSFEVTHGVALDRLRPGIAGRNRFGNCDVLLDALIGIHTPVSGPPRLERRPHIKVHDKLLEGFLYLRPDDDSASGGDYEFFSVKPGHQPRFGKWAQTSRDSLHLERTARYGKGTLVIVVNTSRSIQALTARGPGNRPLMYANFTVQTPRMLFDLDYTLPGRTHRFLRGLADRVWSR